MKFLSLLLLQLSMITMVHANTSFKDSVKSKVETIWNNGDVVGFLSLYTSFSLLNLNASFDSN